MTPTIIITIALVAALTSRARHDRRYELITPRPYNNQYSDASAARDGWDAR